MLTVAWSTAVIVNGCSSFTLGVPSALYSEDNKYAFVKIKDANDKEVSDYSKYTVESSDKNILMLGDSKLVKGANDYYVQLKAVTTGTAYIIIKKDGKYCTSLPINVVA